jgi:hypothetical protein
VHGVAVAGHPEQPVEKLRLLEIVDDVPDDLVGRPIDLVVQWFGYGNTLGKIVGYPEKFIPMFPY